MKFYEVLYSVHFNVEHFATLINIDPDQNQFTYFTYLWAMYEKGGLNSLFALYQWFRNATEKLNTLPNKWIGLAKHVQLFWNNLGDVFASLIESKYVQSGREDFYTCESIHKDN